MSRRAQPHPTDEVARRLYFTRLALGYTEQGEFARAAGLTPNTYNPYERGSRTLNMFIAQRLSERHKLPLEWLFEGVPDRLPHALVVKLTSLGAPIAPRPGSQSAQK